MLLCACVVCVFLRLLSAQDASSGDQDLSRGVRLRGRLQHSPLSVITAGDFCYTAAPGDKNVSAVGLGWACGDFAGGQSLEGSTQPTASRSPPIASFPGHSTGVSVITLSPTSHSGNPDAPILVATGDTNGSVGVWCMKGRDVVARAVFKVHASAVTSVQFTRDGKYLLSASLDGGVFIL